MGLAGPQMNSVSNGAPRPPPPQPQQTPVNPMMGNLAAALANAKLKKTAVKEEKELQAASGSGGGMASMMDEMAKTLARRRAQADASQGDAMADDGRGKSWDKNAVNGNSPCKDSVDGNGSTRYVSHFWPHLPSFANLTRVSN